MNVLDSPIIMETLYKSKWKSAPKKLQKHEFSRFFGISGISGGRLAHPRAAQWEFHDATRWGYTWDTIKKRKTEKIRQKIFFRWKIVFERFWKFENFKKLEISKNWFFFNNRFSSFYLSRSCFFNFYWKKMNSLNNFETF